MKEKKEQMQSVNFNLSFSDLRKLITLAKKNNSGLGEEMRRAIKEYIERHWQNMQAV